MSDRIEKLYDRWSRGGTDEDNVHAAIDTLLERARILQKEDSTTCGIGECDEAVNLDDARIAVLATLADLAGIEPDYEGPWHVVQYTVTREFGGHEEGDWYYDWYANPALVATLPNSQRTLADWVAKGENEREKEARKEDGRPQGRFSVLGGEDIVYVVEQVVGESESTEHPHYE